MYELVLLETTRIEHWERLERAAQERLAAQVERSNDRQLTNQGLLSRSHWLTSAGNWLRTHTVQPGLSQR
ncbi:MAG: hypothetical protein DYG89_10195 [Caldilinea sp. CFX5]|nr:hypothetical protein [Caldilinea sp. CFX5]